MVNGERITGSTFIMPDHAVEISAAFVRDGATMPFIDVPAEAWYFDAVSNVYAGGLMEGVSAAKFNPSGTMTRAMVWAILARMDGETITGATWEETARAWAMNEGISDGTNPNSAVTREQLAAMLYRYAGSPHVSTGLKDFQDAGQVSSYAVDAMAWAVEQGIITGKSGARLDLKADATRAEMAAMLMRYCNVVTMA